MAVLRFKGTDGEWHPIPARGPKGADGMDGASAYELAVAQGYTGTLAQWLAEILRMANIANNLSTADAGKVLDARQGKVLNDTIVGALAGRTLKPALLMKCEWTGGVSLNVGQSDKYNIFLLEVEGWLSALGIKNPATSNISITSTFADSTGIALTSHYITYSGITWTLNSACNKRVTIKPDGGILTGSDIRITSIYGLI